MLAKHDRKGPQRYGGPEFGSIPVERACQPRTASAFDRLTGRDGRELRSQHGTQTERARSEPDHESWCWPDQTEPANRPRPRRSCRALLDVHEFVNADQIAVGLSGFAPETVAIEAGRIMLARIRELARPKTSTLPSKRRLASRTLRRGFESLSNPRATNSTYFSVAAKRRNSSCTGCRRLRAAAHGVPEETIRRRYHAGMRNFFDLVPAIGLDAGEYSIIAGGRAARREGSADQYRKTSCLQRLHYGKRSWRL